MAKNRMISTSFWNDNYSANLDPIEKLLFLYLITNERSTLAGIYELPIKFMAVETGIEGEMVKKILYRFEKDGKIKYVDGWVAIKNFSRHHETGSPTVRKGIEDALKISPDWTKRFIGYAYPIDTLTSSALSSASLSVAPLRRLVSDSQEEEIKPRSKAKYPNARETASWLPFIEESWFINTTELKHLELLFLRGEKKVRGLISFILKHKDDQYCPKFTKPSDLERKWRDYQDYADKNS